MMAVQVCGQCRKPRRLRRAIWTSEAANRAPARSPLRLCVALNRLRTVKRRLSNQPGCVFRLNIGPSPRLATRLLMMSTVEAIRRATKSSTHDHDTSYHAFDPNDLFAEPLLTWYDRQSDARKMPWRKEVSIDERKTMSAKERSQLAYAVWVSETCGRPSFFMLGSGG